jgi:hypothetical protein
MEKINFISKESDNNGISISIVNNYKNNDYSHFYRIFDLKRPVENIGLIGVESNDQFAIKIENKKQIDFSFSLYLDGVSVSQENGIKSINDIKENDRENYNNHDQFICEGKGDFFMDRFSQISGKNRNFVFTDIPNTGVNENLISDISKLSRVEIYFWEEKPMQIEDCDDNIDFSTSTSDSQMKIGAGEETNQKFNETTGLENPKFLGKIMVVYVDKKFINGNCKVLKNGEFDFEDPMDLIPKP